MFFYISYHIDSLFVHDYVFNYCCSYIYSMSQQRLNIADIARSRNLKDTKQAIQRIIIIILLNLHMLVYRNNNRMIINNATI